MSTSLEKYGAIVVENGKTYVYYGSQKSLGTIVGMSILRGLREATRVAEAGKASSAIMNHKLSLGHYLIDRDNKVVLIRLEIMPAILPGVVKDPMNRKDFLNRAKDRWSGWDLRFVETDDEINSYACQHGTIVVVKPKRKPAPRVPRV